MLQSIPVTYNLSFYFFLICLTLSSQDGNIKNALLEIISLADGIISKIELKDLLGSMEEAKIDKYEGSSEATEVIRR